MVATKLLSIGLAAVAAAVPINPRQITCASGLYILVARGSNEPVGEGDTGAVANMIEARVPGSYSVGIDYPASIDFDDFYFGSVNEGVQDTQTKIRDYVAACGSGSRIALLGYSQGGHVVTDTLAGGTLSSEDPLEEQYRKNIVGAAVFGDPRFNAGQPISAGTSTSDGIFARDSSRARLNTYSNVLRSYCDEGDPFCSSDGDLEVHYATVAKYAQAATDFIVGLASS